MKFYRGSARAARAYVEADHSRADDYYLAEGAGVAARYVAQATENGTRLRRAGDLDGPAYEQWVAGHDIETGAAKGRLRDDAKALRFVEITINGPKSWSLAAALHPEVSTALDAAQTRAAEQVIDWLASHAVTRVGPRGRQVQVPVEQIEATVIRHYTSRAGDPHRHLHLQINARVFAQGKWRGLHSVGARDFLEALNGIGHAAVATDPEFRDALARHGLTFDPASGELAELAPYVAKFSARTTQIARNIDRFEARWRTDHPGEEPGPRLRQTWDRRAWADARPDKVVPRDGAAMVDAWNEELRSLGYRDRAVSIARGRPPRVADLDRDNTVGAVLTRLGAKRSSWNAADIRGQVEQWIAQTGVIVDAAVRIDLAEDITARAVAACTPLLARDDAPEHVRALTSPTVIGVEDDICRFLGRLASHGGRGVTLDPRIALGLDAGQRATVGALAGTRLLLVVEGAAGAGKTTTLAVVRSVLADRGHRMMVVTPTLKAAEVAAGEIAAPAFSAAWLAHQWGWRWDDDGRWSQAPVDRVDQRAALRPGDLLVVDEAGMLDQDTARAVLAIAHRCGARVALVGDRHQLPAVGRGGVLDLAARYAGPEAVVGLEAVHRFADPAFADLSVRMRRGDAVFDELWQRGQIRLHASDLERLHALADASALAIVTGTTSQALMADSRDHVASLNGAIRDRLVALGYVGDEQVVVNSTGERLGVGDHVTTRRNDWRLGVANRQRWIIAGLREDATVTLRNERGQVRWLPTAYVQRWVELAYATTVYGAQGETTHLGHMVIGGSTSAASAYVGMTRGRCDNVAHLVAETREQAQTIWEQTFSRGRADLGVAHARLQAVDDIDRYGPAAPARHRSTRLQHQNDLRGDSNDSSRRPSITNSGIRF